LLVLYAGNMGIMHPLDEVLDAAALCGGLPVRFLLVGDGVRRESLLDRVKEEEIPQVSFLPYQPESQFARIMAASDVSLVVLQPGLEGLAVPSKAYTSMGAGKPLIALMEPHADVAKLVVEHDCGWNVTSAQQLAALLRDLTEQREELARRGMNGRKAYDERFTRDRAVARYVRILSPGR
jgi:glycosyltransferase involved in cell wall biosynthesis